MALPRGRERSTSAHRRALEPPGQTRELNCDSGPGRHGIASLTDYGVLVLGLLGLLVALSAACFRGSQLTLVFGELGVGIGFGCRTWSSSSSPVWF